jgi:hypothetical protein
VIGGSLQAVAVISSSDVWAVVWYKDVNGVDDALIEYWTGSAWKLGSSGLLGTDVSANGVVAISAETSGWSGLRASPPGTVTAHWDAAKWKTVQSTNQSGPVEDFLHSVRGTSRASVWAVGWWTEPARR